MVSSWFEDEFDEEEYLSSIGQGIYGGQGTNDLADPYNPYDEVAESPGDFTEPYYEPSYQQPSYPSYQAPAYEAPSYGGGWGGSVEEEVAQSPSYDLFQPIDYGPAYDYEAATADDEDDDDYESEMAQFYRSSEPSIFDFAEAPARRFREDVSDEEIEEEAIRRSGGLATEDYAPDWADILRQLSGLEGAQTGFAHGFDIPYVSDFMREEVQPRAGDVGEFFGREVAPRLPGIGNVFEAIPEDWRATIGRGGAEALTPVTGEEFLLEGIPGVGSVPWSRIPDAFQAARRAGGNLADEAMGAIGRNLSEDQPFGPISRAIDNRLVEATTTGRIGPIQFPEIPEATELLLPGTGPAAAWRDRRNADAAWDAVKRTLEPGGVNEGFRATHPYQGETGAIRIPGRGTPPPAVSDEVLEAAPADMRPSFPRPSSLRTVDDISQEAQWQSENFAKSAVGAVGQLPIVRSAADAVNPSALLSAPPSKLVDELGLAGATKLQGDLLAHSRKLDQANALATAIEDGIRQRARAVGLTIEGSRVTSVPGSPHVGDLFENPSQYKLTAQQSQFVDQVRMVLDDMNGVEKRAGVKKNEIFSDEGRYFPRRVLSVDGVENLRPGVRRGIGAKQSFQKGRFYEFMEEGSKNGVNYGGDIAALVGTRIRAGLKATADAELAQLVRPLGHTLTKETPMRVGEMGTMVPAIGGRAFPQETAKKLIDAMGTHYPGSVENAVQTINNVLRPFQLMIDVGYWTLQLAATGFNNPAAFAKALGYSLDALVLDGRFYGKYLLNNVDQLERFVPKGLMLRGTDFSFDQAARGKLLSKLFKQGPGGRFGAAFDNAANVAALENAKAMAGVSAVLGPGPVRKAMRVVMGDISGMTDDAVAASIANKMVGRVSTRQLGVGATQQFIESNAALAPNYYRAAFGLLGDAMQGGMRGAEARRTVGSLIAGAAAGYYGIATALGQEPDFDPFSSRFMTVRVGNTYIGMGGPIHGFIRTLAEAYQNPDDLDDVLSMQNPLTRWARGRASPLLSLITDIVAQQSYMGALEGKKDVSSWQEIVERVGLSFGPIAGQTAYREGLEAAAPGFAGLRSFPVADSTLRDEEKDRVAQELFQKPYRELFEDQQRQVDADARVSDQIQGTRTDAAERGSVLAQNSLTLQQMREERTGQANLVDWQMNVTQEVSGQDARVAYGKIEEDIAREAARLAKTPEAIAAIAELEMRRGELTYPEQAQADYYKIFDRPGIYDPLGNFNFSEYERGLEEWQAQYPGIKKSQVSPGYNLSPGHAELETAKEQLNAVNWFDAYDTGYEALRRRDPGFAQATEGYETWDEFRNVVEQKIRQRGVSDQDTIDDVIYQLQNDLGLSEIVNIVQADTLRRNPQIIPLIEKWYDLDEGELRILQDMRNFEKSLAGVQ